MKNFGAAVAALVLLAGCGGFGPKPEAVTHQGTLTGGGVTSQVTASLDPLDSPAEVRLSWGAENSAIMGCSIPVAGTLECGGPNEDIRLAIFEGELREAHFIGSWSGGVWTGSYTIYYTEDLEDETQVQNHVANGSFVISPVAN